MTGSRLVRFDDFMNDALYGASGFYTSGAGRAGRRGDFITAPEVGPLFGTVLARAVDAWWIEAGRPDHFRVYEIGAGPGTLARSFVAAEPECLVGDPSRYVAAEVSARQRANHPESVTSLAELPDGELEGVVIANELLDNLPFRWLRSTEDGFREIRIDDVDGAFVPVETPCDAALADLAGDTPEGCDAFVSPAALDLVDDLATWLRRGYALIIDYGWPDRPAREVHGYRDHRFVGDVLGDPGSRDITAGVDFGAIERHARDRGLVVLGSATQADALRALGYDAWQAQQRDRQAAMLGGGDHLRALRAWEGRGLASVLVDPERLGGFRWLLLATPGLPAPDWL